MRSAARIIAVVMTGGGLAGALTGCSGGADGQRQAIPPQTVSVARVELHDMAGALRASGRLLAREEAAVALDVGGFRVRSVLVEEGAQVRAGQVLAVLDPSLLLPQIAQLRATVAQQEATAEQAREQAARVTGLENEGILSNEAIANRKFGARSSQAALAATRAQLREAETRLGRLQVRALVSGTVLERNVRPGDTPAPGSNLFTIARNGLIELHAELPEAAAASISRGDPAEVRLPSGRTLSGTVRLIGARVDSQSGAVTVRIALPRDGELRQGGFAEARFTRSARVISVPELAVQYDTDGAAVRVIGKDRRVRRVPVRTGQRANGMVELREGPPAGELVAVKGGAFTLEGDLVRIEGETAR